MRYPPSHGRTGRPWRRIRDQIREQARQGRPCHLCGQAIDLRLDPRHRMSFTVEHLDPVSLGIGNPHDITRLRPAHRACNSSRGNRPEGQTRRRRRAVAVQPVERTSRDW